MFLDDKIKEISKSELPFEDGLVKIIKSCLEEVMSLPAGCSDEQVLNHFKRIDNSVNLAIKVLKKEGINKYHLQEGEFREWIKNSHKIGYDFTVIIKALNW